MGSFRHRFFTLLTIIILVALSTGCKPKDTVPAPEGLSFGGTPDAGARSSSGPVDVVLTLDESAAVSALIPQKGGELSVSLANGMVYSLAIPEGALLSDQEVSLTPIRSVEGLPLSGGLIGGVLLEPDGTSLLQPATLTIEVPEGYDLDSMVGFGAHGQGDGFYLSPAIGDGKIITLSILTFSPHGAASGTDQEVTDQANRSTGNAQDDMSQDIADILDDPRARDGSVSDSDRQKVAEVLKDFYDKTLKTTLQKASTDDAQIDAAVTMFLNWLRSAQLLGIEDDLGSRITEGTNLVIKGLRNAFDKAYQRCINTQDIKQSAKMLTRLYQLALLGGSEPGGYTLDGKEAEFQNCVRYKLNLESILTWEMETNMNLVSHVTGNLTLKMDSAEKAMIVFKGQGDLTFAESSVEWVGESEEMNKYCKADISTSDGTFEAVGRIVWYNLNSANPKESTVIAVKPSNMGQKSPKIVCEQSAGGGVVETLKSFDAPMWSAGFDKLHEDIKGTLEDLTDSYLFTDFDYVGGNVVARLAKSYNKSVDGAKIVEDLTMDVTGAPGAD